MQDAKFQQGSRALSRNFMKTEQAIQCLLRRGTPSGIRTLDTLIKSQVL